MYTASPGNHPGGCLGGKTFFGFWTLNYASYIKESLLGLLHKDSTRPDAHMPMWHMAVCPYAHYGDSYLQDSVLGRTKKLYWDSDVQDPISPYAHVAICSYAHVPYAHYWDSYIQHNYITESVMRFQYLKKWKSRYPYAHIHTCPYTPRFICQCAHVPTHGIPIHRILFKLTLQRNLHWNSDTKHPHARGLMGVSAYGTHK